MEKSVYQLTIDEALQKFSATESGLSINSIADRQAKYGKNIVPQPKSKSVWAIFIHQFLNPLIYVLIVAAIISGATGDIKDAIFIAIIIVINAVLGTYQEWRAENSASALKSMVRVLSRVKRDGRIWEIDSEELVPGDIVLLESGQKIPADLRLIEANDLSVEEALLTGESVAVMKSIEPIDANNELSIGDRVNMGFTATTVQKGRGIGLVVGTAKETEIGKIAESLRTTESEKPPLVRRMESFSKQISILVLVICVLLGVIGYLQGMHVKEIFFLMIAVGVSAIPEGLPVALTVALSIGTRRMAKRNVIVRKLPAVEGLGSCTLIASDKTGTLTMDEQSVKKIYLPGGKYFDVTGQGYNGDGDIKNEEGNKVELTEELFDLIRACILSNEGILRNVDGVWEHSGDAVDVSLRALAYKVDKDPAYFKKDNEVVKMVPYESENKFSAVFFKHENQLHFAMKGALEIIADKLPASDRDAAINESEKMASEGYRVLAIAGATVSKVGLEDLPELKILGLLGLIDPLRAEAKDAVSKCQQAGIQVRMVTGDHPSTALAIAKDLGIAETKENIITGAELSRFDQLPISELAENIKDKKVFARVAPLQKQRIVEALKSLGNFVAVTGDGANDAPALKSAHIGVAMGAGTDLAKEASSIIVTDNNFASITAGVEEGRYTYDNLRKIIYMLISTGLAELLTVGLAIFTNIPIPFLAVQLLWLNLVTNGIQDIALAFEKGDPEVMKRPPRKPSESIFDKLMNSEIIISAIVMAGVSFGVWYYLLEIGYTEKYARTLVMMLMVLMQNFHVLNCRSETKFIFKLPVSNNYVLLVGIIIAQLVHISASYIPGLSDTLQLNPILLKEWLILVPTAAIIFVIMELFKWFWMKYQPVTIVNYQKAGKP